MALRQAVEKLESKVKDLTLSVTQSAILHLGKSEKDQGEVLEWIEKVARGDLVKETETALKELDSQLVPRTYLVNNYFTAADVALYGALYPTFSKMKPPQYYSHPSLTRYFDHIQSLIVVRKSIEETKVDFPSISFDLEGAPKQERKAQPHKKKEKAATAPPPQGGSLSAVTAEAPIPDAAEGKDKKREKKEKKKPQHATNDAGKAGSGSGKSTAEDSGEPVPSMIDLRVGHIVDVKKHPDADGLYVEEIDLGEETGPRTVVSGLVHYVPIEQMRDKYLIVVCNLKPATMRGVKSFGMVLAATSREGKEGGVELIEPPPNSKPGDRVYFEGADFENATPLAQLNPKKKVFETIQPGLTTLDSREAAWINPVTKSVHRIRTTEGICSAPTFVGASLS